MKYDHKTYGASPFGNSAATASRKVAPPKTKRRDNSRAPTEALGDQLGEPATDQTAEQQDNPPAEEQHSQAGAKVPALPSDYAPVGATSKTKLSFFYIPKGRVLGLNLVGEAVGWMLVWGTVGFFRASIPLPVLAFFDLVFHPWATAVISVASAFLLGRLLRRYQIQIYDLRNLATTAIEYGELNHRADVQSSIDQQLTQAAGHTRTASRWLVSWLTALACLFIIGAFY